MGSQLLNWFINSKTWRIGGNLKKNSSGLVEVDRVEVFTVPYLGYMDAEIHEFLAPFKLLLIVWSAPCNMMDGSNCYRASRKFWQRQHINQCRNFTIPGV